MFCPKCGTQNKDKDNKCVKCQTLLHSAADLHEEIQKKDEKTLKMFIPMGRSGLAVAAGYAGLFAIIIFPSPVAVILGILALIDIKKHPKKIGKGRAIFGLIMGVVGTAILAWALINSLLE